MKILQVENIANVSYHLSKGLVERGYDVTLIVRRYKDVVNWDLPSKYNDPWIHFFKGETFFDKTIRYCSEVLSHKVDIIHCHYALEQGLYGVISKRVGRSKKLVIHGHGTDLREIIHTKKYGWMVRLNLKEADKVLVSTSDLLLRKDFELFPNPIDETLFTPNKPSLDLHKGHDYAIFCPSRQVWRHKGQDKFLQALKTLVYEGYDIMLTMINYGEDYERSKNLVKSLNLEDHILFVDAINPEDMPAYYNSCDLVWSQFGLGHIGLTTLESMSCNKITFADLNYESSYDTPPPIVNVHSVSDIIDLTKKALNKELNLGTKPREWVLIHHGYSRAIDRLEEIYSELLSSSKIS